MSNIRFPSILKYDDVSVYLSDFVIANEGSKLFSHRSFSKEIKWPLGLLSDVIKKRRNLTPQRCVEFSTYASFSSVELERLLLISIKESLSVNHRDLLSINSSLSSSSNNTYTDNNNYRDVLYSLESIVITFGSWGKGRIKVDELQSFIKTFEFKIEDFNNIIKSLIDKNIAEVDDQNYFKILKHDKIILDEHSTQTKGYPGLKLHKEYAKSFLNFCDNPSGPACYNSGMIVIPKGHFMEYAEKIIGLREWFLNKNEEVKSMDFNALDDSEVFQLDLNLFSVTNHDKGS